MLEFISPLGMLATVAGGIIAGVWSLAWWLSRQFSEIRNLLFDKIEKLQKAILDKLEYHERYDDIRFSSINNELWEVKVRLAAREGLVLPSRMNPDFEFAKQYGRTIDPENAKETTPTEVVGRS